MPRPLALADRTNSSVALGFLLADRFRDRVAFADDPAVVRVDVNLTCERCPLPPDACLVRAAPPKIQEQREELERHERALQDLIRDRG